MHEPLERVLVPFPRGLFDVWPQKTSMHQVSGGPGTKMREICFCCGHLPRIVTHHRQNTQNPSDRANSQWHTSTYIRRRAQFTSKARTEPLSTHTKEAPYEGAHTIILIFTRTHVQNYSYTHSHTRTHAHMHMQTHFHIHIFVKHSKNNVMCRRTCRHEDTQVHGCTETSTHNLSHIPSNLDESPMNARGTVRLIIRRMSVEIFELSIKLTSAEAWVSQKPKVRF